MSEIRALVATTKTRDFQMIETVLRRLSSIQWTIVEANDGQTALFKLENQEFDLLVVENSLQKHSGQKVWQQARNSKALQEIPVIWLGEPLSHPHFQEECFRKKIQVVEDLNPHSMLEAVAISVDYLGHSRNQAFSVRVLRAGEYLMREGDLADAVFILKSGKLRVTKGSGKNEQVLGAIDPGEFVGEMAYLSGETRSADVRADVLSELVSIPISQFDTTLANRPTWAQAMMKNLARRLKQANLFSAKRTLDPES